MSEIPYLFENILLESITLSRNHRPRGYGKPVVEIRDNKYKSVKHLDYYKSVDWKVQNQVGYQGIGLLSAPTKLIKDEKGDCKKGKRKEWTYCLRWR